ncbi:MAG: L-threonylcarbamoyladenylate synthase [Gammaproteobacteria bacterium]
MSKRIRIHPVTPQPHRVVEASAVLASGGVLVYPTDSCYALGCDLGNADGVARIRRIRHKSTQEPLSLLCRDLSEIAIFSRVDNQAYRLLKKLTPGPYTFILKASREVPKRVLDTKRKTIGIRVPENAVAQALLEAHGAPVLSSTAQKPGEEIALNDAEDIWDWLSSHVDAMVDGGPCGLEPTSVIDLTGDVPRVVRVGAGDVSMFI